MTTLNRIGSVSLLNNTLGDVGRLQQELADLQEQVSSGVKAKSFQGLNGQVEQFTLLESKMRRTDAFISGNEVSISRLQTADQAVGQVVDIADQMENLIVTARDATSGAGLPFKQQMGNLLESMARALNISFDGRYLFSGTATNVPPMPDTTQPPVQNGVPDASYYKGSQESIVLRTDETSSSAFPVRADDPAFQKVYAAAHAAMTAFEAGDDVAMAKALDLMQAGQTGLNAVRSSVNMGIINMTNINERLESLNLYWKGVTEKVGKTDIVAATTQIASYEAVLQATFQVYARLSQLKLSDYL